MKYIIFDSIEEYKTLVSVINSRRNISNGTYSYPVIGVNAIAMRIDDDEIALLSTENKQKVVNELSREFMGDSNETI